MLRSFDINFLVLFLLAILCQIIAIKTPQFLLFDDMSAEEEEATDMKVSSAFFFFIMASVMLLILYLFID